MAEFEYKNINVSDLALYLQNPRLSDSENQVESVRKMIQDQGEGLLKLASSIVNDGLSPIEIVGVAFDEQTRKYVVLEGNRRVCALKLLNNPSLADDKSFRDAFEDFKTEFDKSPISEVRCAVFPTVEDSFKWVIRRHTGQQEGAGMVPWNPIQQDRSNVNLLKRPPTIRLQLVESLGRNPFFDAGLKYRLSEIPITNIERLFNNADIRLKCGYEIKNGMLMESNSKEYCGKVMSKVFNDFLPPKGLTVATIYKAEDRMKYIDKILTELGFIAQPEDSRDSDNLNPVSGIQGIAADASASDSVDDYDIVGAEAVNGSVQPSPRPRGLDSSTRKTLWTRGQTKPLLDNPKASKIYDEIKKLDCNKHPIIVSLGMRALIAETTERCYQTVLKKKDKDSLSRKLVKIKNHLKTNNREDLIELRKLDFLAISEGATDIPDVALLHSYEHQDNSIPTRNDLFSIWDRFCPVIDAMGHLIREGGKRQGS